MEFQEAINVVRKYDSDPDIYEALRWITPVEYKYKSYKERFEIMTKKYKEMLREINKSKTIELGKTYWATEWSWSPLYDGRGVFEETIREHTIINGIDCYFTNSNNRVYFKEDLYENKEDAEKICSWQNSFSYDYESIVSRQNDVKDFITFKNFHWVWKE